MTYDPQRNHTRPRPVSSVAPIDEFLDLVDEQDAPLESVDSTVFQIAREHPSPVKSVTEKVRVEADKVTKNEPPVVDESRNTEGHRPWAVYVIVGAAVWWGLRRVRKARRRSETK